MKLSIYTFVKDGLYYDYHVVAMLKHHLPLADEIIVNEGYSTDGTLEAISKIDSKIKVFQSDWGKGRDFTWYTGFKNASRQLCTGDWCILLDCDEFIPEWDFEKLRKYLESTSDVMIPVKVLNFYGNYRVWHSQAEKVNWPARKMIIHRNIPEIEIWGDGSNVRLKGVGFDWGCSHAQFECHHFGFVRHPARLRQKWRNVNGSVSQSKSIWFKLPAFLFDWRPHNWLDPQFIDDLNAYEGPYVQAVRDDPREFVRDNFSLYEMLSKQTDISGLPK